MPVPVMFLKRLLYTNIPLPSPIVTLKLIPVPNPPSKVLEYIQYQELLQMTQLRTSGLSKEAEDKLRRGQAITQLLIQNRNNPVSTEVEMIFLFALSIGVLDRLSAVEINQFKYEFIDRLEKMHPGLLAEIRKAQALTDSTTEKLYDALGQYFQGG